MDKKHNDKYIGPDNSAEKIDENLNYEYIEHMYDVNLRDIDENSEAADGLSPVSRTQIQEQRETEMELYDWVQCIVSALLIGILLFVFVVRVIGVEGSSMFPTLYNQDKIVISKLFYTPECGDIIVLQTDTYGEVPLVKRIIAKGGQTVDIDFDNGIVYVDGTALEEDYIAAPTYDREDFEGPITVPEGCVFVMGDNRATSQDSRNTMVGCIAEEQIVGRAILRLWPLDQFGIIHRA